MKNAFLLALPMVENMAYRQIDEWTRLSVSSSGSAVSASGLRRPWNGNWSRLLATRTTIAYVVVVMDDPALCCDNFRSHLPTR
jgi:hypothetical protein